jgi:hypothetical protein
MRCPKCSSENPAGAEFCDQCGASFKTAPATPVASGTVKCKTCNTENAVGNVFCDSCGSNLTAAPVMVNPPPSVPPVSSTPPPAPQPPVAPPPIAQPAPVVPPPIAQPAPVAPPPIAQPAPVAPPIAQPAPVAPPIAQPAPVAPPIAQPAPVAPPRPQMIPATPAAQPPPPGHPRLVVMPSGAYFDLFGRAEILIGRLDPITPVFPEVDLTGHGGDEGGVSRKHAHITLAGNQYFVEDLGSSNGTSVNSVLIQANVRTAINNGDQLRLGRVILNFFTGQ